MAVRPLGLCEGGGALFFSSGQHVYRRVDGAAATWRTWATMDAGGMLNPAIGGIRGLTAIASPAIASPEHGAGTTTQGQALLFIWTNSSTNQGCIYRIDIHNNNNSMTPPARLEVCLASLMRTYLNGTRIEYRKTHIVNQNGTKPLDVRCVLLGTPAPTGGLAPTGSLAPTGGLAPTGPNRSQPKHISNSDSVIVKMQPPFYLLVMVDFSGTLLGRTTA